MLPTPRDQHEAALWQAHIRLDAAREEGRDLQGASECARRLVADLAHGSAQQIDALGAFLRRLDTEVEALEKELDRVRLLLERAEHDRRRFRAFTFEAVDSWAVPYVRGALSRLGVARGPETLEVENVNLLPAAFVTTHPERREARERDLRAALKDGAVFPGARLVPGSKRLVVR